MSLTRLNKSLEYERNLWPLFSFAGGPTQLPRTVLYESAKNFLQYKETGLSILELSYNSKEFHEIYQNALSELRTLYQLPSDFKIFFSHGTTF
jgi:phosphoserine aminotransferase